MHWKQKAAFLIISWNILLNVFKWSIIFNNFEHFSSYTLIFSTLGLEQKVNGGLGFSEAKYLVFVLNMLCD